MNKWSAYNGGNSIGTKGVEGGVILYDEEHPIGARITFKRAEEYVLVSVNIYGWMNHTRFFTIDMDAQREYKAMKSVVNDVLNLINSSDVKDIKIWEALSDFVRRFP
jgi:hypothetical protein